MLGCLDGLRALARDGWCFDGPTPELKASLDLGGLKTEYVETLTREDEGV